MNISEKIKQFFLLCTFSYVFCPNLLGQDFSAFYKLLEVHMLPQDSTIFDKLLSDGYVYYESVATSADGEVANIYSTKFWLKDGVLIAKNISGKFSDYDPAKDFFKGSDFSEYSTLYRRDGSFSPMRTNEGVSRDVYDRNYVKNSEYPKGVFRNLNFSTSAPVQFLLVRLREMEANAAKSKQHIDAVRATEMLEELNRFLLSLKNGENSLVIDECRLNITVKSGIPHQIHLIDEKGSFFIHVKNRLEKTEYPQNDIKTKDLLSIKISEIIQESDYGFLVSKTSDGKFKLEFGSDKIVKKLYDNSAMSIFFSSTIESINGEIPRDLESIYELMAKSETLKIVIIDEELNKKTFEFRKMTERDRIIIRFSDLMKIDTSLYFPNVK